MNSIMPSLRQAKSIRIIKNLRSSLDKTAPCWLSASKRKTFLNLLFLTRLEKWSSSVKDIQGVENILSIADAVNIKKNEVNGKATLESYKIFENGVDSVAEATFRSLPFYENLLYNPESNSYLTAIYLNPSIVNSPKRIDLVNQIEQLSKKFEKESNTPLHYSGLPYIRTRFAEAVKKEMRFILIISLAFTSLILLVFFSFFYDCSLFHAGSDYGSDLVGCHSGNVWV